MKKFAGDAIAIFIIAFLVISFFWKYFFPTPQLLVTPDFGRSDAWHFSFATKFLLSQSLKRNELPLWTSKLGTGFPILAEGQTGTFFLPNLILYKLFDAVIAYNVSFVFVAISIGWGMYVFLRRQGYSVFGSWFGGMTFAFSGLVMTELPHITLLQGFSLLPWVLVTTDYLLKKKSAVGIAFVATVISQQLFAGFPQAVVISLLFAGGYFFWHTRNIFDFLRFGTAILLGAGLSSVQLLPSWEFLQNSSARGGFSPQDAAYFSYPFKHVLTFIDPFKLGNPKFGTYPAFTVFNGSIFWENTGYIGIVPLLFAGWFFIKQRMKPIPTFFFVNFIASFLLMVGSHGPLYIIYSFWPFNLFRVPSRFLWIFVFCLIIFAASGFDRFRRLKFLVSAIAILGLLLLMKTWGSYQAWDSAKKWLTPPDSVKLLSADRIYSIGNEITHNQTFLTKGWQDMNPYFNVRSALAPDSNVYWNVSGEQVYAGRFLRRQALVDTLLKNITGVDEKQATVSAQGKKLYDIFGIRQMVSTVPLDNPDFTETGSSGNIRIYANPGASPRVYLAHHTVSADTVETAVNRMSEESFVPGFSAVTEQTLDIPEGRDGGTATVTGETDTSVTLSVRANSAVSLLVLADTYYPGWRAYVDGREAAIQPVNINERAVSVNPGNHTVRFLYDPDSLRIGAIISAVSLFFTVTVFLLSFAPAHRRQTSASLLRDFSGSRGRSQPHRG